MILDFVIIFVGSAVIGASLGCFSALLFKPRAHHFQKITMAKKWISTYLNNIQQLVSSIFDMDLHCGMKLWEQVCWTSRPHGSTRPKVRAGNFSGVLARLFTSLSLRNISFGAPPDFKSMFIKLSELMLSSNSGFVLRRPALCKKLRASWALAKTLLLWLLCTNDS